MLRAGGNAIDAAVAASFALGVVEPDASGIGGDGMALVWRAGSQAPIVVDFKDQAPAAASLDNPAVLRDGRLVDHGPAALNIPGVVAGMDYLHQRYGSGRVAWADLTRRRRTMRPPASCSTARCRRRWPKARPTVGRNAGARALFMPGGRLPQPGDRFVNADLAATLRIIAARGADASIAASWRGGSSTTWPRHGGILTRRRSRAVPRHRADAGARPLPRPRRVLDAAAGRVGHGPDRSAADAGSPARGPRRAARARRRRRAPADRDVPPRP